MEKELCAKKEEAFQEFSVIFLTIKL